MTCARRVAMSVRLPNTPPHPTQRKRVLSANPSALSGDLRRYFADWFDVDRLIAEGVVSDAAARGAGQTVDGLPV
jgi:hypothetical protein